MGENVQKKEITKKTYRAAAGTILIFSGMVLFVDQYLKTGWLSYFILPAISLFLIASAVYYKKFSLSIPGSILLGIGLGIFILLFPQFLYPPQFRIGLSLIFLGSGWILIAIISKIIKNLTAWWALLTGSLLASLGLCFLPASIRWTDFVLFPLLSISLTFFLWGFARHLFGLIITACILSGIGSGIYMGWGYSGETNDLARVGIMLVCFGLGWGLITIVSRLTTQKFIWWPLIPAGIIAVVGWGLYFGGNSGGATTLLGNMGSVSLIIFGFYLLLMREGFRR